jgi:hypothetical protein
MSKWPMRGHFRYLRFKTFPMTPRTPQCEVFWALLSSSEHSRVPKDSKSPTLEVLGFTPTFGQSGVATIDHTKVNRLEHNAILGRDMDMNSLTWLLVTCVLFQMYTTLALIQSTCNSSNASTWHPD